MHSSIPPTLPFPVSCGRLRQPNNIVHVKICAFKCVPSQWNASQLCNKWTQKHFFCFVLHINLIFKNIYNVKMMFWWFVCLFFLSIFPKRCLWAEHQVLFSVELTCYNEIIELVHHTADVYCVCRAAANRNGYRWRA